MGVRYFKYQHKFYKSNPDSLLLSVKMAPGVFLVYQKEEIFEEKTEVAAAVSLPGGGYTILSGEKGITGDITWNPFCRIGEWGGDGYPVEFYTRDLSLAVEFMRKYAERVPFDGTPTQVGLNILEEDWMSQNDYDPSEPPDGETVLVEDGENPHNDEATIHYPIEPDEGPAA